MFCVALIEFKQYFYLRVKAKLVKSDSKHSTDPPLSGETIPSSYKIFLALQTQCARTGVCHKDWIARLEDQCARNRVGHS